MDDFVKGFWVLAVGLVGAAIAIWRLRRSQAKAGTDGRQDDLDLEIEDLRRRRRDLYERLGSGNDLDPASELDLASDDRRRLEHSAARVLRDLEAAEKRLRRTGKSGTSSAPSPEAPRPIVGPKRAGLVGFAFGAGMVALVAVLFFWAGRDATPTPDQAAATGAGERGDDLAQLDPQVAARVRAMREQLQREPTNLETRKALAETLISEGLLFDGYQETQQILEQSPEDPDGLYLQGLVRLMMGQSETAVALLDRAIEGQPQHVSAYLVRGLARLRLGNNQDAISDWETGLEASGGTHPGLERLLEMAREGKGADEILGVPASASAAPTPPSDRAFTARVELAFGANPLPGSVLFVFLRTDEPGPPAAVRRIDNPVFPIDLSLDDSDSMLGRPLPDEGTLSARLDADGNASTQDPGDLAAEVRTRRGEAVSLVLRP